MKITICGKGGCGKSTITSLLAKALSRRGAVTAGQVVMDRLVGVF